MRPRKKRHRLHTWNEKGRIITIEKTLFKLQENPMNNCILINFKTSIKLIVILAI